MKPSIYLMIGGLLMATAAQAHVGSSDAGVHAAEHLWLLLWLVPALLLIRPLRRQVQALRQRRR